MSFAEMAVTDPGGVGTELDLLGLRAAIDDMAAWTGLDGVCVPEIRLSTRDDIRAVGHDAEGVYLGDGEPILVTSTVIAFHELCHAVDRELGRIHTTRPDLFEDGERFAVACEEGPVGLALAEQVGESCGLDLVDPTWRFLQEEVFVAYRDNATLSGVAASPLDDGVPVGLSFDPEVLYVFGVGGSRAYVHVVAEVADATDDRVAVDHVIDATTGSLVAELPLAGAPEDDWDVLSGDSGVVVIRRGESNVGWWIPDEDLAPVDYPLPEFSRVSALDGYADDGVLWLTVPMLDDDPRWPVWIRADGSGGAAEVLSEPDGRSSGSVRDGGDGPLAVEKMPFIGLQERVVRLDATSRTREEVMPLDWGWHTVAPLADGTLLASWSVDEREGWMVGDPASGSWSLAQPSCETVEWNAWRRVVTVAGRTMVVQFSGTDGWRLSPTRP